MARESMGTVLLFGGVAVAAWLAYKWGKTNCPSSSGTLCGWFNDIFPPSGVTPIPSPAPTSPAPASGTASTPVVTLPPAASPPSQPTPAAPSAADVTVAALSSAAAGGNSPQHLTFDQWSWYFQYSPPVAGTLAGFGTPGSISGALMSAIITAGGGDRSALISPAQFVQYLSAARAQGIQGLGQRLDWVPVFAIHGGD